MALPFRTGFGFDVHRLVEGRDLWIGGVKIEHSLGLLGHSDADVAIHALCDAMLGAAALRDIGFHFPDSDPAYKGIDSKKLLRCVADLLREKGYTFGNAPPCRRLWLNALAAIQMTSRLKPLPPSGLASPDVRKASPHMPPC